MMKYSLLTLASLLLPWSLAQAQTSAQAYQAIDGPVNADVIRWLDFSGMTGAGPSYSQDFLFDVPSPSGVRTQLALTLERGYMLTTYHGTLSAQPLPAYVGVQPNRGSAFGLTARYRPDTAAREPALRSRGGIMRLNLNQLVLTNPAGHELQFQIVAVDAEETTPLNSAQTEGIRFTTDGGGWIDPVQLSPLAGQLPATVLATYPDPKSVLLQSRLPLLPENYAASAWMHTTTNPSNIVAILGTEPGLGDQSEAQAVAFGVIPLIPEARVTCTPATLVDTAGQSATCTVDVVNPPRSAYAIALSVAGNSARFSSDCASVSFTALQTQATCTVTATPNSTPGDGDAPVIVSVSSDPEEPSWLVTGSAQTITVRDSSASGSGVTAVPTLGEWMLTVLGLGLGALGLRRIRRRG
ncbi:IPTL-CTERM sorting domain-containing protein [Ottowia thiooxydans]